MAREALVASDYAAKDAYGDESFDDFYCAEIAAVVTALERFRPLVEAARKLEREVTGMHAFRIELCECIGNTNFVVLDEKRSAVEAALRDLGVLDE